MSNCRLGSDLEYAVLQARVSELEAAIRGLLSVYAPTARNRAAKERALAALTSQSSGEAKHD